MALCSDRSARVKAATNDDSASISVWDRAGATCDTCGLAIWTTAASAGRVQPREPCIDQVGCSKQQWKNQAVLASVNSGRISQSGHPSTVEESEWASFKGHLLWGNCSMFPGMAQ